MRPSGVQTFTRTTGSFNTRSRITRPKRAWALRSPASSCSLRAGSAMPSPASRVISLASRIASLARLTAQDGRGREAEREDRQQARGRKPQHRPSHRAAATGPGALVRLTRRAMSIPGVWQSRRVVGPMSTGGLDRRTGTVMSDPKRTRKELE